MILPREFYLKFGLSPAVQQCTKEIEVGIVGGVRRRSLLLFFSCFIIIFCFELYCIPLPQQHCYTAGTSVGRQNPFPLSLGLLTLHLTLSFIVSSYKLSRSCRKLCKMSLHQSALQIGLNPLPNVCTSPKELTGFEVGCKSEGQWHGSGGGPIGNGTPPWAPFRNPHTPFDGVGGPRAS